MRGRIYKGTTQQKTLKGISRQQKSMTRNSNQTVLSLDDRVDTELINRASLAQGVDRYDEIATRGKTIDNPTEDSTGDTSKPTTLVELVQYILGSVDHGERLGALEFMA